MALFDAKEHGNGVTPSIGSVGSFPDAMGLVHGTWLNHESNSPDTKSCVRNQSLPMRAKSQQPQNITTKTSLTTLNPKRIISLALKSMEGSKAYSMDQMVIVWRLKCMDLNIHC